MLQASDVGCCQDEASARPQESGELLDDRDGRELEVLQYLSKDQKIERLGREGRRGRAERVASDLDTVSDGEGREGGLLLGGDDPHAVPGEKDGKESEARADVGSCPARQLLEERHQTV